MQTFSERFGFAPVPQQLKLEEISQDFRIDLWTLFYRALAQAKTRSARSSTYLINEDWFEFIKAWRAKTDYVPVDETNDKFTSCVAVIKEVVLDRQFYVLFDLIEISLELSEILGIAKEEVAQQFEAHMLAYRVFDGTQIGPISSDEHAKAVEDALAMAKAYDAVGAKTHLLQSSGELMRGKWADSIRESIHAVEAASRKIAPEAQTLGAALKVIEQNHGLHPALKQGFSSLYGFTSDEDGIRHAILDEPKAPVDEATALFMHGACASFVTYLLTVCSSSDT